MPSADLILYNATVLTLDPQKPMASAVAVLNGHIAWVGATGDASHWKGLDTRAMDCAGKVLAPGFNDAHIHLIALAASLMAVDCSPRAIQSIEEIKERVRQRATRTPAGQWVRGHGYDEFQLRERRHPSRWDLDAVITEHPVRLDHRSGHGCVLNSLALSLVGISSETPEPPGGYIERDEAGEPTGLLLEMNVFVSGRMGHLPEEGQFLGLDKLNTLLLSQGITAVQDATHTNSLERWRMLKSAKDEGKLAPRVTFMPGIAHLDEFLRAGLHYRAGTPDIHIGPAKVMLTATAGALHPSQEELSEQVAHSFRCEFPVAIHAVEAELVEAAIEAIEQASGISPALVARSRIEHCSECPPALLDKIRMVGVQVVTQPGFLYYSGRRYLATVPKERQTWLYRTGSLQRAGVPLAFGSDAPVIPPNPLIGLYAAITRRAETGEVVLAAEGMSLTEALRAYTVGGSFASGQGSSGTIEVGQPADLVVLSADPAGAEPEALLKTRVEATVIGRQVVWEA